MAEVKRFMKLDDDYMQDDKLIELRMRQGHQGISVYLALASYHSRYVDNGYEIPNSKLAFISYGYLGLDIDTVKAIVTDCIDIGLFHADKDKDSFYSRRRRDELLALDEGLKKMSEAGKKAIETRWEKERQKNKSNTNIVPKEYEPNTNRIRNVIQEEEEEYRENSRDKSIELNSSFSYSTRNCAEKKPDDESVLVECANTCSTGVQQVLSKCQAEEEEEEREEKEQDKEEKEELLRRKKNNSKSIELNSSHSYIVRKRKIEDEKPENESVLPEKPEKASKGKKSTSLNHPSSLDEVKEYAREMGYTYCNCREWWDFNEARGWILNNGRPIKDWKAQLRYSYSKGYSRSKETEDSYDGRPFNPNLHNSTDEELETMFMTDEEKAEWEAKKKAGEKNVGA